MRNVLFLCTGNSARSILAEALLNSEGRGRFRAFSAGSHPIGTVHPLARAVLADAGVDVTECRSKRWDEFGLSEAPVMDIVITVCDDAAGETCPIWPGAPVIAHWSIVDPSRTAGTDEEKRQAFADAFATVLRRVRALVELPLDELDRESLRARLAAIGNLPAGRT